MPDETTNDREIPCDRCARCGEPAEYVPCAYCCGECYRYHDCGEDMCCCPDPVHNVECDVCEGTGGAWHCTATPEFCVAHPLPGREAIPSTALSPEAWRDAD